MKPIGAVTVYEDFKYVLQDAGNVYLGASYSYEELLEQEAVPFKLKTIISHYILKEASPDTTLESQFYYLEGSTFLYETFKQLKIKIKVQIQVEKKSLFGKPQMVYEEKILTLTDLINMNLARKKTCGLLVREIIISKLALMTFSV